VQVVHRGNIQVSAAWYQHTIEADQHRLVNREKNIRTSQAAKRNLVGLPDISSPAKKAALARKITEKEDEFQAVAARRRALNSRAKEGVAKGPTTAAGSSVIVGTSSASNAARSRTPCPTLFPDHVSTFGQYMVHGFVFSPAFFCASALLLEG
jgi:hypothetical protein